MTRAIDRLIVSGAIDPSRAADQATPIGWVLGAPRGRGARRRRGRPGRARPRRRAPARARRPAPARGARRPTGARAAAPSEGQLALFVGDELAPLPPPAPRAARARAGARAAAPPRAPPLLQRARALRALLVPLLRRARRRAAARGRAGTVPGRAGLAATEIGDAVHRLLESSTSRRRAVPDVEVVRAWYPAVTDEELERIRGFVASYCESELAAPGRRARRALRRERPFAFEHDGVLLHGRLDVLRREGGRALVLDYKTNSLAEGDAGGDRRGRLPAAAARLRARVLPRRRDEVEVVYHFLERPDAVVSTTSRGPTLPGLEAELSGRSRGSTGRVPADAERVHLRRLPGARPCLRRTAAPLRPDPGGVRRGLEARSPTRRSRRPR